MTRFTKLTFAAAALSLGMLSALPASAADVVVSLKGKSAAEIKTDIRAAAEVVCRDAHDHKTLLGGFMSCVDAVYDDAMQQIPTVNFPGV